jgi:hypothetical protein
MLHPFDATRKAFVADHPGDEPAHSTTRNLIAAARRC